VLVVGDKGNEVNEVDHENNLAIIPEYVINKRIEDIVVGRYHICVI